MKKILPIILAMFLLTSCGGENEEPYVFHNEQLEDVYHMIDSVAWTLMLLCLVYRLIKWAFDEW